MRKGISSLCGVVHEKMRSDVRNGDVFIFIGSSRRLMELLRPLYEVLKAEVMKSDYVQADETTTPVMNKETHKAAQNMAVVCSLLPHKWKLTHPESVMTKTT